MPAVEARAVVDPQNRRRETMKVGSEPYGDKGVEATIGATETFDTSQ
jgi:hypothetical protein